MASRKSRLSSVVRTVFKVAVTLGILAVLLLRVDMYAVGAHIASIGIAPALGLIAIILVLSVVVAFRWHIILAYLETTLALVDAWRLVMIGLFFNHAPCM